MIHNTQNYASFLINNNKTLYKKSKILFYKII